MNAQNPYTITGLKTWETWDGGGYSATLRRDGRIVGELLNDGNGGGTQYRFNAETDERALRDYVAANYKDDEPSANIDAETALTLNVDCFIGELVDDVESAKRIKAAFKRALKSKILFVQTDGRIMQCKFRGAYKPEYSEQLLARNPGALILNAKPEAEALELYRKHFVSFEG
jgi:hypothetical protein